MKNIYILTALMGVLVVSMAQTASDYYMPLCVGNQTVLRTEDNPAWEGRLTTYSIIRTDTIGGIAYAVKEGKEYSFRNPTAPHAFQYFWLRKDVNGELLLRAYGGNTGNLADAVVLPTEGVYFSNSHLSMGYHISYSTGANQTFSDSVISIHAAFGPFTDCIQSRETNDSAGVIQLVEDKYYAYGVGEVGEHRTYPVAQTHIANFATAFVTGCTPIVDTLTTQTVDTCFGQYFDYYISNVQIDTVNKTISVTWVFQDSLIQNQFVQSYNYLYQGNNLLSITINCTRAPETFFKAVYIGSAPSGIQEPNQLVEVIKIYPNPAGNELNINLGNRKTEQVTIYNVNGETVIETKLAGSNAIDISNLAKGVYVAEIKIKDSVQRVRWVKM